ncbi:hypothetical protein [Defluviitalea saccharophila]|uniref:Uncharacterized protein n=1 Tax=Defluviitalea saccharophila TaxID=879970 RepID=A0ABZ2Y612_9FIRM
MSEEKQCESCKHFDIDDWDIEVWLENCRGYCLLHNWVVDSDYHCKEHESKNKQ